ncbi:Uncharacterised protein [Candidatus Anstonella stagnisolia]|nr:Uncharacterised protein [Candidatus Anstonella stagnisolia]
MGSEFIPRIFMHVSPIDDSLGGGKPDTYASELRRSLVRAIGKSQSIISLRRLAEFAHIPFPHVQDIYESPEGREAIDGAIGTMIARMDAPDFLDRAAAIVQICQQDYPDAMQHVDARLGREIDKLDDNFHYLSHGRERWLNQNVADAYYGRNPRIEEEIAAPAQVAPEIGKALKTKAAKQDEDGKHVQAPAMPEAMESEIGAGGRSGDNAKLLRETLSALETLEDFPTFKRIEKIIGIKAGKINALYGSDADAAVQIDAAAEGVLARLKQRPLERRELIVMCTPKPLVAKIDACVMEMLVAAASGTHGKIKISALFESIGIDASASANYKARNAENYDLFAAQIKGMDEGRAHASAAPENATDAQLLGKVVSTLETLDDFPTFKAIAEKSMVGIADIKRIYGSDIGAAQKIEHGVRDALGRIGEKPAAKKRNLSMGGTPEALAILINEGIKAAAVKAAQASEAKLNARDALREIGLDYSAISNFKSKNAEIYGEMEKEVEAAGVGKTSTLNGMLLDEDYAMKIIEAAKNCDRVPTTAAISDITGIEKSRARELYASERHGAGISGAISERIRDMPELQFLNGIGKVTHNEPDGIVAAADARLDLIFLRVVREERAKPNAGSVATALGISDNIVNGFRDRNPELFQSIAVRAEFGEVASASMKSIGDAELFEMMEEKTKGAKRKSEGEIDDEIYNMIASGVDGMPLADEAASARASVDAAALRRANAERVQAGLPTRQMSALLHAAEKAEAMREKSCSDAEYRRNLGKSLKGVLRSIESWDGTRPLLEHIEAQGTLKERLGRLRANEETEWEMERAVLQRVEGFAQEEFLAKYREIGENALPECKRRVLERLARIAVQTVKEMQECPTNALVAGKLGVEVGAIQELEADARFASSIAAARKEWVYGRSEDEVFRIRRFSKMPPEIRQHVNARIGMGIAGIIVKMAGKELATYSAIAANSAPEEGGERRMRDGKIVASVIGEVREGDLNTAKQIENAMKANVAEFGEEILKIGIGGGIDSVLKGLVRSAQGELVIQEVEGMKKMKDKVLPSNTAIANRLGIPVDVLGLIASDNDDAFRERLVKAKRDVIFAMTDAQFMKYRKGTNNVLDELKEIADERFEGIIISCIRSSSGTPNWHAMAGAISERNGTRIGSDDLHRLCERRGSKQKIIGEMLLRVRTMPDEMVWSLKAECDVEGLNDAVLKRRKEVMLGEIARAQRPLSLDGFLKSKGQVQERFTKFLGIGGNARELAGEAIRKRNMELLLDLVGWGVSDSRIADVLGIGKQNASVARKAVGIYRRGEEMWAGDARHRRIDAGEVFACIEPKRFFAYWRARAVLDFFPFTQSAIYENSNFPFLKIAAGEKSNGIRVLQKADENTAVVFVQPNFIWGREREILEAINAMPVGGAVIIDIPKAMEIDRAALAALGREGFAFHLRRVVQRVEGGETWTQHFEETDYFLALSKTRDAKLCELPLPLKEKRNCGISSALPAPQFAWESMVSKSDKGIKHEWKKGTAGQCTAEGNRNMHETAEERKEVLEVMVKWQKGMGGNSIDTGRLHNAAEKYKEADGLMVDWRKIMKRDGSRASDTNRNEKAPLQAQLKKLQIA